MTDDSALTDMLPELRKQFTGDIRTDLAARILYSTDASIYQIEPLGVVIPRNMDDLQAVVELAGKYEVPILPRGSGSSLAGQAIGAALVVDCSRWLDNILNVDPESRTAKVEPGVILTTLNRVAAKYGLQFGPDPASAERATMGGVIANNATGAHSIRYGMSADHIISAEVLLADGIEATLNEIPISDALRVANKPNKDLLHSFYKTAISIRNRREADIRNNWPSTWRNSAGYRLNYLIPWSATKPSKWEGEYYPDVKPNSINLAKLLAGSEGTLAVIRTITVNLVPKPAHTILAVLTYNSVAEACDAVPDLLKHGPSAVELIPRMLLHLARDVPAYARMLDFARGDPAALLVMEFSGDQTDELIRRAKAIHPNVEVASTPEEQAKIWNVRKVGLGILNSAPVSKRPVAFIEDCAIPVERLGEFVRGIERILNEKNTQAAFYAHASAGCLHIRPMLDLKTFDGVRDLRVIAEATLSLTLKLGGSMSSEHGDGILRSEWLRQTYGEELLGSFRELKRAVDPKGILNPGKIVDSPEMNSHLRFGPKYKAHVWQPSLSFVHANGIQTAIEQCNGQGVCRKFDGVMCPSFQASREEIYSTRGRANLLRALINTNFQAELEDSVFEALDLCLACKGCTSECPSGVDMPKLKYEFQHVFYRHHRRPVRDYLFAYIPNLVQRALPFYKVINMITGSARIGKVLDRWLGITQERAFPRIHRWQRPKLASSRGKYLERCLFLPDAFTRYFEPEIETAARKVLEACGVEVVTLPVLGAGRTLISKGFISAAKKHSATLLRAIQKLDPLGELPVVGVEPSEIYTLRDEYLDLLPDQTTEVIALAARTWMIDEYLLRWPEGKSESRILRVVNSTKTKMYNSKIKQKIKLHTHCYQKAQPPHIDSLPIGHYASAELLKTIGYEVDIIASGCCGMAGAFGYEAEHYQLSQRVGELVLLPEVRKAHKQGWGISAVGTSCRTQISDGTEAIPEHPIILVAKLLSNN